MPARGSAGAADGAAAPGELTLVVRRTVDAAPQIVFEAWTTADDVETWWGPDGVECSEARIDLRVGGQFRIGNRFADGSVVWIVGEYEVVDPPRRLVHTWRVEGVSAAPSERVTVVFTANGHDRTDVVITHERIVGPAEQRSHERGWRGCLDGLAIYLARR